MADQQASNDGAERAKGPLGTPRRWFSDVLLRRVFKNAGLLLGGKAFAGLCGLGYLAIAARALGPEVFGTLILVHTYVLLIIGIVNFKSWQALIRYGAGYAEAGRQGEFHSLLSFTSMLDVASAVLGVVVAVLGAPLVGPLLGWSEGTIVLAQLYSLLVLFSITATPIGLLRLFDRFDVLAAQSLVTPVLRVIAAGAAFWQGAGLTAFLMVWFFSGLAGRITMIALGWREFYARPDLADGFRPRLAGCARPHEGIWKFVWATNIHTTLELVTGHLTTLTVGGLLGPAAAGLYKVAQEFSVVLLKPSVLLKQAVYPDLARLAGLGEGRAMGRVVLRSGLVSGAAGLAILAVAVLFGQPILEATVGPEYLGAYLVLVLLVLAATIEVFGFALNPTMYAVGRPGISLKVNVAVMALYFPALLWLLPALGVIGGGLAMVGASAAIFATLALIAARIFGGLKPARPEPQEELAEDPVLTAG